MKKALLLLLVVLTLAVPAVVWARAQPPGLPLRAFLRPIGRLLALLGFILLFYQYVLSSRIKWIERGIGLDNLLALHRPLGIAGYVLLVLHPTSLLVADIVDGNRLTFDLQKILGAANLTALTAAVGAALLYRVLSLRYETWKGVHWANYVVLPVALLHGLRGGTDLASGVLRGFWFGLGGLYAAVLVGKLWTFARVRRHPYRIGAVAQETEDTWSLYFEGKQVAHNPGQFLFLRLIRDRCVSSPHPFTIRSSPAGDRLAVTIKDSGDFTSTVGQTKVGDGAYIDAPYGVFTCVDVDASSMLLIAGGIGVTPLLSMVHYLADTGDARRAVLLWGNRTEADIACRGELERLASSMPSLQVVHVLSRQDDWPGEKGHIDEQLLSRYLCDLEDPAAFVCGPPRMIGSVVRALRRLGVPRRRIHAERFALR
jgi:predicted ferric reductase